MKLSLRITLTTTILILIVLTVAALGYTAYRNATYMVDDLSTQILDQNSSLIDVQINGFLTIANRRGVLDRNLLQDGQFDAHSFAKLARYWVEVLKSYPRLSRMSIGLEATGEWSFVRRVPGDRLAIGELRRDPATGLLGLSNYWPEGYPDRRFSFEADAGGRDPRSQPWYIEARSARRQVWSEAYVFSGVEGFDHVPGVSCVTPFFAADGALDGVLTSSFDVAELCRYLKDLKVGRGGFAFVVEQRDRHHRRVIAHPDPSILIRTASGDGRDDLRELVPPGELADRRVPAFLGEVPRDLVPGEVAGTRRIRFVHDGVAYLGAYRCLSSKETPDWLVCIMMPEGDVLSRVDRSNLMAFSVGLGILAFATIAGLVISAQVARPLERLAVEAEAIGRFEVGASPAARSIIAEVDRLALAVEGSKTNLRSFGKYVPTDLIRQFVSTGREAALGGERRRMTVSFCDLADFTSVAEALSPEDLVRHLSEYFDTSSAEITATLGTVDKYIGDAIMAFWGAPAPSADHAAAACKAALRNQADLARLRPRWRLEGKPELRARIGIHTGEMIVGNIGSEARFNYTVMGDPVNVASRLEGLGKYYGAEILIGEPTYLDARPAVVARPVDWVSVKGKTEGLRIYELLALKGEDRPEFAEVVALSGRALDLYRGRDWAGAIRHCEEVVRLRPGDGPGRVLIARCRAFLADPPADDWDGVHRMASK